MEMPASQGTSWVSKLSSTINGIHSAWIHTPKALKLPIEAAGILSAPGEWKGVLLGVTILTETPQNLASFLCNRPIKLFGERWQLGALFSPSFPTSPELPLTELDNKIGTFERAENPSVGLASIHKPIDLSPTPATTTHRRALSDMEKITDKSLETLIEKVSYFSILQTMQIYCGVPESDSAPLLSLVDEASRSKNPSLWNIFISHYGSKMSLWGRCKAGLLYLLLWEWIPIIPNTVDAYLKNMLDGLRINLKENGEKRKKFINGLLDDADNFFEAYNGAAETYANDGARKGNLNHYRKTAIDLMLPREELSLEKTPQDIQMDLYRTLSASIVDHFSPKVHFGFFEGWLNNRIKTILRDQVLPVAFLNITNGGQEATKRHNIPFFLALTKTLTAQVSDIQGKMEEGPTDSTSLYGIKNFEGIVKKFLRAIDMAECKTAEEVRAKIEELKQPESFINAQVRNSIQFGIQNGLAVLFDYLSKQENSEELFANLFQSIASPLSGGHLPMNDDEWAEIATEYEGAKILLKQAGFALSKQIVQTAVQDKVRGGASPEHTEKKAERIFSEHKARGQKTFEELHRICDAIQKKIHQSKDSTSELNIHSELSAIASVLKAFENKERVKVTMEQDPPPQIATLPPAERGTILRILYPLYEGSNRMMDPVLRLQNWQKQYAIHARIARELGQIEEAIEEISSFQSLEAALEQAAKMDRHFKKIEASDPEGAAKLQELKEGIDSICHSLSKIAEQRRALDALESLQPSHLAESGGPTGLLGQLALSVQGTPPPGFKKWKCLDQIKQNVIIAGFSATDQEQVFELIRKVSKFNSLPQPRPDFQREILEPLATHFRNRKARLERDQKQMAASLEQDIPRSYQSCSHEEAKHEQIAQEVLEKMEKEGDLLQANAARLHKQIERAKQEIVLHPSAAQLGQVGGIIGFLLGLPAETIAPGVGSTVVSAAGAFAAASLANASNLLKGKWIKGGIQVLSTSAAAGFATYTLSEAAKNRWPALPLLPTLIGAIGASATGEYFWANMTKQVIDTAVDVAMPKVTQLFDTSYEHLLTNDVVINGGLKIGMKQVIELFPPKK